MRRLSVGTPAETKLSMCGPTGKPRIRTCHHTCQTQAVHYNRQCGIVLCVWDEVCEVHKHQRETEQCVCVKKARRPHFLDLKSPCSGWFRDVSPTFRWSLFSTGVFSTRWIWKKQCCISKLKRSLMRKWCVFQQQGWFQSERTKQFHHKCLCTAGSEAQRRCSAVLAGRRQN